MPDVAYVLKAYPRLSEPYITSEIHRIEQAGVRVRLFAIKQVESWERAGRYPVLERIRAQPRFLPEMTSLSGTTLRRWLPRNLPPYAPSLARCLRLRPVGTARAIAAAAAQTVRARRPGAALPRTYLKELLQA